MLLAVYDCYTQSFFILITLLMCSKYSNSISYCGSSGGSDDIGTIAAAVLGKDNIVPALVDSSRQS